MRDCSNEYFDPTTSSGHKIVDNHTVHFSRQIGYFNDCEVVATTQGPYYPSLKILDEMRARTSLTAQELAKIYIETVEPHTEENLETELFLREHLKELTPNMQLQKLSPFNGVNSIVRECFLFLEDGRSFITRDQRLSSRKIIKEATQAHLREEEYTPPLDLVENIVSNMQKEIHLDFKDRTTYELTQELRHHCPEEAMKRNHESLKKNKKRYEEILEYEKRMGNKPWTTIPQKDDPLWNLLNKRGIHNDKQYLRFQKSLTGEIKLKAENLGQYPLAQFLFGDYACPFGTEIYYRRRGLSTIVPDTKKEITIMPSHESVGHIDPDKEKFPIIRYMTIEDPTNCNYIWGRGTQFELSWRGVIGIIDKK
jgi:hypothetical protein